MNTSRKIDPLPDTFYVRPSIVFIDVDDTLTSDGRLPLETFNVLLSG